MKQIKVGLIAGKYKLPVDKSIFEGIDDVFDIKFLRETILNFF